MQDSELSLDDIFSRLKKDGKDLRKGIRVPFKFLDSYTREDESIFFGRDNETEEIFRKLYSGKLLLVYGKSGTGKSSIINCGLISKIPQEDLFTISIRCGKNAYQNFISEIKKYSGIGKDNPLEILEDIFYENSKPVALVFDQFEEVFILSDREERKKLAAGINKILKSRLKINIIMVIREEYFANLTEFESIIPSLYGNRVRIERINRSSAKEAIIKPCLACDVRIEEELADKIIEQLLWQSEVLELTWLQILMDSLYRIAVTRDHETPVIKNEDLISLGRIGNVLSNFLDEQLRLMPGGDLGEAVLKTMISTDGTKKLVNLDDISDALKITGKSIENNVIEGILMQLVNVRILKDKDEEGFYELRHDAIAARIYERMTAPEKEMIEVRSFLDNSLRIYKQRNVLLTENDLKYIAQFGTRLILSNELKNYIELSRKELHRTRLRRRNLSLAAVIVLIAVLSGFSIWALSERSRAFAQTHRSRVLLLVSKAREANFNDPTKAIRYAQLAFKYDSTNILANQTINDIFNSTESKPFYAFSLSHNNDINSAVFSPDGKNILTASTDKTVRLWDISGKCLVTLPGHSIYKNTAVFSPDGKTILTASIDNKAKLWDLSGKCLATFPGHTRGVVSVSFSPDGKNILTSSNDKTAKLWDLKGNCLVTFSGHKSYVMTAKFSPDGKKILTTSYEDFVAKLWDLSGKCLATYTGHTSYISSAHFSPDSKTILTASEDGTAKLWDLEGKCLITFSGHSKLILSALFSPDGRNILTASSDNTAKLWNLSGKCLVTFSGHTLDVLSAIFSPDGKNILTASVDNTAKLWDLSGRCQATFSGHTLLVWSAVFSPDGKKILTASRDVTAKMWDLSGKCLITLSGNIFINSAVFSPDGKYILTAFDENTAKLWDRSGKSLVTLSGHTSVVISACFSCDGKKIITASNDSTAKVWDTSGKCLTTLTGHTSRVISAIFSPDGKNMLTASGDSTAKLWNLSGKCLATFSGHTSFIFSALFSPDGSRILTSSGDNTAKLWDLTGKCLVTLEANTSQVLAGHDFYLNPAIFSPDGRYILTVAEFKAIKLWDLSGKCLATFSGHKSNIWSAVFSPDSKKILSSSDDYTSKLWDLTGICLATFAGHTSIVFSAAFSPDGRNIVTCSDDYTSKLWDLSGKCYATLSGHSQPVRSAVFSTDGNSILTISWDNTIKLWLTPSAIFKWLDSAEIGSLSPADKSEIEELDDIHKLQTSDDLSMITEYADWYLNLNDTANAEILYEKALQINPMSIDKSKLGNIYRKQNRKDKYLTLYKDEPQVLIKDEISALKDTSSASNYYGKFLFFSERARLFERLFSVEPEDQNKSLAASSYNDVGWYGLFAKQYDAALTAVQRGLELDPSSDYLHTNLPLCYLLAGQFEKAKTIYSEYKDKTWSATGNYKTFKDAFLADLADLESKGITNPDFEKIRDLFKK